MLYLTVLSNCSIRRAEMVVSNCIKSETEDFATYSAVIQQGSVTVDLFPVIFQNIRGLKQGSAPFIGSVSFSQVFVFL